VAYLAVVCRVLIAVVFLVSVATKVADLPAFVDSVRQLRVVPAPLARACAGVVVVAEAAIVLLLAVPVAATALAGFGLAVAVLVAFGAAITLALRRGRRAPCRCFGRSTVPLGPHHVARNGVLAAVAVLGAVATAGAGPAHPGGLAVAAVAGAVAGLLVTALDDIVALFRPTAAR
jgi:uncharacterized membrane protein YphA (DoxX/SURF4 family)